MRPVYFYRTYHFVKFVLSTCLGFWRIDFKNHQIIENFEKHFFFLWKTLTDIIIPVSLKDQIHSSPTAKLNVKKSQKLIFLKRYCPKSKRKFWRVSGLVYEMGQKKWGLFLSNLLSRKNLALIAWSGQRLSHILRHFKI